MRGEQMSNPGERSAAPVWLVVMRGLPGFGLPTRYAGPFEGEDAIEYIAREIRRGNHSVSYEVARLGEGCMNYAMEEKR
jgi:hypothetical protein